MAALFPLPLLSTVVRVFGIGKILCCSIRWGTVRDPLSSQLEDRFRLVSIVIPPLFLSRPASYLQYFESPLAPA